MKMTTKMIMLQNIEKMVMEQQRVDENDSYIRQDNEDLKYLEERYDQLQLSHTVKRVIDDYIACLQTRDERYSDLAYAAGIRDTISLLQGMGMLNGTAAISEICKIGIVKHALANRKLFFQAFVSILSRHSTISLTFFSAPKVSPFCSREWLQPSKIPPVLSGKFLAAARILDSGI